MYLRGFDNQNFPSGTYAFTGGDNLNIRFEGSVDQSSTLFRIDGTTCRLLVDDNFSGLLTLAYQRTNGFSRMATQAELATGKWDICTCRIAAGDNILLTDCENGRTVQGIVDGSNFLDIQQGLRASGPDALGSTRVTVRRQLVGEPAFTTRAVPRPTGDCVGTGEFFALQGSGGNGFPSGAYAQRDPAAAGYDLGQLVRFLSIDPAFASFFIIDRLTCALSTFTSTGIRLIAVAGAEFDFDGDLFFRQEGIPGADVVPCSCSFPQGDTLQCTCRGMRQTFVVADGGDLLNIANGVPQGSSAVAVTRALR
jgi:hypothetical protein